MVVTDELPPTATKMYASFILHTIFHYLKRVGMIPEDKIINKLEQLSPVVSIALQQLEITAFDGLVKDKIVFTVEELPVLCKDDPTCYGLLQSTECYSAEEIGTPTQSFNFLHLGIQEYFAAKYVTTLPEDEVYTLLKESFIVYEWEHGKPYCKSIRLSNMWILYCGITSGQCKALRHYLTTYGKPDPPNEIPTLMHSPNPSVISQRFDLLQPSSIHHPVTPLTQLVYNRYPLTPSRGQHTTSYPQPHHLPTPYQKQQLVQYPYHQPSMTNPLLSANTRSHNPMLHPMTMYRPTMTHLHSSHDEMVTPPAAVNSHVFLSDHTTNEWSFDQRVSNTGTISEQILNPVNVLYLFQCFQEAQDNVQCEVLTKSFDSGEISISLHTLLPHQVVSLGFFLSKSHRKYSKLNLMGCHIRDHGMSILHQYLCRDEANKQQITEINLTHNDLTGASSHLIVDIIIHLQPHTLVLGCNNITNVKDISNAVITGSTVKVLDMGCNDITAQEAVAISDMMICLEELDIEGNKLGDHGAELLSEQIANTKTLRVLSIGGNNIGPSGTNAIANALANNTSLEELHMDETTIGAGAVTIAKAITNKKTLQKLSLQFCDLNEESAMIIIKSLHYNDTITHLYLPILEYYQHIVQKEVTAINNRRKRCNKQCLQIFNNRMQLHL